MDLQHHVQGTRMEASSTLGHDDLSRARRDGIHECFSLLGRRRFELNAVGKLNALFN